MIVGLSAFSGHIGIIVAYPSRIQVVSHVDISRQQIIICLYGYRI